MENIYFQPIENLKEGSKNCAKTSNPKSKFDKKRELQMRRDNPISKLFEQVYGDSTQISDERDFREP